MPAADYMRENYYFSKNIMYFVHIYNTKLLDLTVTNNLSK